MKLYVAPEITDGFLRSALAFKKKHRVLFWLSFPAIAAFTVAAVFIGKAMAKIGAWGEQLCAWMGFDPWE